DLGELTKKRLISLAWMLIVEEGEEVLETMVKADIIKLIKERVGEEDFVGEISEEEDIPSDRPDLPDIGEGKGKADEEEEIELEESEIIEEE
ncbi:unnamed protein product, partial [marine sediment metagenome]